MEIKLSHNKFGGWVMEINSEHGISVQYPQDKQDLIKRLSKQIMDNL